MSVFLFNPDAAVAYVLSCTHARYPNAHQSVSQRTIESQRPTSRCVAMRLDATARVRRRAHRRRAENTLHRMRAPPRPARGDSRRQRRNHSFQFSRAFGRASHLDASRVARIALLANMTIRCVQTEKRKYSRCFFAVWVSSERARQRQSNVEEYRRERDIVRGSPWTGLIRSYLVVIGRFVVEWVHTHIIQGTYTTARGLHARAFRRHRRARERCAGANRRAYDRRRIERACPREGVART